jgi:hypothetical protein
MKIWICAIAKMEELYIREWIDWHKKLGIDHIVLGDNNDSDYKISLQSIIQDYIDEGYVELVNKQNEINCQQQHFYNEIYQTRKHKFDWIGFIDIDEFIELPAYKDIHLFLNENRSIDAVVLPWKIYGDNEHIYYENKPVKERFISPNKSKHASIKYFIKSLDKILQIKSFHIPFKNKTVDNLPIIACDSTFEELKIWNLNSTQILVNKNHYNTAYISHYITKSTEEYIKYKVLRGRADRAIGKYDLRYTYNFYFKYNIKTLEKEKLFEDYQIKIKESENEQLKKYGSNI